LLANSALYSHTLLEDASVRTIVHPTGTREKGIFTAFALALCVHPASAQDIAGYWSDSAASARASQPDWSSPIATTTALLEQRLRFDVDLEHSGNDANTTVLDGGRGLDLIISPTNEIQIAAPPYELRSAAGSSKGFAGFADWTFLRLEQRLVASPTTEGDYVVTAWLQIAAPTGTQALTSHTWSLQPTLAFGKGWGPFDAQATVTAVLPTANANTLGQQIQANIALQYHVGELFWPEVEANWTYYPDGQRAGLNQLFLTPGFAVGRLTLSQTLKLTLGFGYQFAVSPNYRPKPLTPTYAQGWLFSSRLNF
jgi:hypothetical protein